MSHCCQRNKTEIKTAGIWNKKTWIAGNYKAGVLFFFPKLP